MRKSICVILHIFLCISTLFSSPLDEGSTWNAGVARIDITPESSMWLAGYAHRNGASEGGLHSIWAKALILEDPEGNRGVLVTTDLVAIPKGISDQIRNSLNQSLGLEKSQIILNCSHTHSGPVVKSPEVDIYPLKSEDLQKVDLYSKSLVRQILTVVHRAYDNMEPAKIFSGNGQTRFQVNRRNNTESTLFDQNDLNGPHEYSVPVLKVENLNGNLKAIVFGYACHATVLDINQWSGDYPGFAQIELEKDHPGAVALFFQGAGGDQNPLPRRSVPLARQYGRTLAAAVYRVLEEDMNELAPILKMQYREVDLRLNPPPSELDLKTHCESTKGYLLKWGQNLLKKMETGEPIPEKYPFPIQIWKVGAQAIFTLGGEPVIDYSITLKRIFGYDAFVMGYSNDVMAYIPSARILHEGGYEGASSQMAAGLPSTWAFDIENSIINNMIEMAESVELQTPENPLIDR